MGSSVKKIYIFMLIFLHVLDVQSCDFFHKIERKAIAFFNLTSDIKKIPVSCDEEQDRFVVLNYGKDDVGVKKAFAFRIDNNTVACVKAKKNDGSECVWISSQERHGYISQLSDLKNFTDQKDLKKDTIKAVVLIAFHDRDYELLGARNLKKGFVEKLQELHVQHRIVPYTMVPGNDYRNIDHFEVQLNKTGVIWKSATHGFAEYEL